MAAGIRFALPGMTGGSSASGELNKKYNELKAKVDGFDPNNLNATDITDTQNELNEILKQMDSAKPIFRRGYAEAIREIPVLVDRCRVLLETAPQPASSSSEPLTETAAVEGIAFRTSKLHSRIKRRPRQTQTEQAAVRSSMQEKRIQNARRPVDKTVVVSTSSPSSQKPAKETVESTPVADSVCTSSSMPPSALPKEEMPTISSSSSSSVDEASSSGPSEVRAPIIINYPVQLGKQLYLFGEGNAQLSWKVGLPLIAIDQNTWTLEKPLAGPYTYKLKMNTTWEKGGNKKATGSDPITFSPVFSSTPQKATPKLSRLTMLYDAKPGVTLEIYGTGPGMTWKQGLPVHHIGGNIWLWETDKASAKFEYKIVAKRSDGKAIWEGGKNRPFTPGKFEVLTPRL